jgi:DNA-binding transcriptional regulator YiaG
MPTAKAETQDLVIWTEKSALDEAKTIFSHFDAAIRPMSAPHLRREKRSGVFVFFLPGQANEASIASALRNLESSHASALVFYLPQHSSDFAFRVGKLVVSSGFPQAEWAFNMQHLRQLLRARNIDAHSRPEEKPLERDGTEMVELRKRLGLTQTQFAEAAGVTPRTLQSWEKGIGTSQIKRRMRDLTELTALMDEYISAPREQEWLSTPLPSLQDKTPRDLISGGRVRDLIVEFLRMREGQPV